MEWDHYVWNSVHTHIKTFTLWIKKLVHFCVYFKQQKKEKEAATSYVKISHFQALQHLFLFSSSPLAALKKRRSKKNLIAPLRHCKKVFLMLWKMKIIFISSIHTCVPLSCITLHYITYKLSLMMASFL